MDPDLDLPLSSTGGGLRGERAEWNAHDHHLRREARRHPRLHRRGPQGQGARGDRRLGDRPARLERVAVPAASGGRRGDRERPRRRTAIPDPDATLLRRRIAERFEVDPPQIAVSNGSCEILLAAALALCEPGAELVYAWPSFSIYPYLAPLSGAREIRVPLTRRDEHDLDAIASEITAATQLVVVCNPNNPTATHIPAERIGAFLERVPGHVTVILDEAYVEFQTPRRPRRHRRPAARLPEPGACCAPSRSLRARRACASATRCARPASAQRWTPFASRSASTRSPRPPAPRRSATPTTSPGAWRRRSSSGSRSRRASASWACTPDSQANFSWIDLGDADEAEVVDRLADAGIVVRPGRARRPRPHPGLLRDARREPALPGGAAALAV